MESIASFAGREYLNLHVLGMATKERAYNNLKFSHSFVLKFQRASTLYVVVDLFAYVPPSGERFASLSCYSLAFVQTARTVSTHRRRV